MNMELHEVMRHSQALLEATGGQIDQQVAKARLALEESLAAVKGTYDEFGNLVLSSCKGAVANADRLVRNRPYAVLGGTFVVGLLLGWGLLRK
jgi:ElaB/YqjD/DUF883 family membrane-anchored ribosome-binding protein